MARPLRALGIRSPAVGLAATLLAAAHGKAVLAPPDALRPRAAVVVAWAHETVTWGTTCVASPRPGADPVAFELPIRRELLPPGREAYDWGYDCDLTNLEFLIAPSANNDTRTVAQRRAALPPPPNGCGPHDSQPFCRRLLAAWLIALAYAFYMMAATSDRYLVPALNLLCRRAGVPNGLAAATVLALGCNTPVLFALMTATFSHPNREASHVGPGVVLGAGPFNLLFAIGASVFAVGGGLRPEPGEMVRELVSLAFAVMALFLVMEDSLVQWWEALLMVVLYTCYVGLGVLLATARQPVASSAVASTRGGGCGGVLGAFQCFRKVTANKAATSPTHGVPQPPPSAVEPPARPSHVRIGTLSASDAARSTLHATGTRLANVRQNRRTHAQSVAPEHNVGADQTPEHRAVDVPEPAGDGDAAAERRADTRAAGAADAAQLVVDVPAAPAATAARDVEAALDDAGCPERIEIVTELPPPPPDHVSWEARLAAARARRAERAARGARVYDESRGAVGPSRVAGVLLVPSRLTPRVLARAAGREWRARFFVPLRHNSVGRRGQPMADGWRSLDLTKFESVELAPAGAGRANAEIWLRLSRADVDPHVLRCPPTMHPHLAQHWADELSVRIDELGARARYAAAAARAGGSNSDAAVLHAHEASRAAASVRPHLSAELALALDALTLLPDTLLRISIPDPLRHPSAHVLTLTLATAWLGAQAYAMTFCLDSLSCALGVSQMVAGNTLGAVGASLPNLVAVVITARQGLPTRSLAQAIGANTFNILVGLGSVWLVQALGGRCKYGAHSTIEGDCAGCFMPVGFEHACPRLDAGGVRGAGAAVGPVLPPGSVLGSALVIYMCIALLAGALLVGCGALSRPAALVLVACYALWFAYQLAASLGAVATLCVLGDVCL